MRHDLQCRAAWLGCFIISGDYINHGEFYKREMWARTFFLPYGRKFNVALNVTGKELVATKLIQPGDRIRLQPPELPAEAAGAARPARPAEQGSNVREILRRQYDVENESWVSKKTA